MSNDLTRNAGEEVHLRESAVAVKDAVVGFAGEAGRYAKQHAHDARESAVAMMGTAKKKAGEYNDTVVSFVRENPYKSVAIAAGVGLLAGILLRRR